MTDTPILHVDMDAFYASVATRERPDLADVPVIVGGGSRGVVLSANYLARQYGVRPALPMTRARRMCPQAVVMAPDFEIFQQVSASVLENFRRVTPLVVVVSLDEAFLDVRGSPRRLGSPVMIAEHLRSVIYDEQAIACSVGVAASVSVAKLASRRSKSDGVVVVPPAGIAGRTVTIRIRFADFTTITRPRTLPEATDVTVEVYRTAIRLYDALGLQRARLRLVGVRVEGLWSRARACSASWCWESRGAAGPTPTERWIGQPGASARPPCVPRACCGHPEGCISFPVSSSRYLRAHSTPRLVHTHWPGQDPGCPTT